MIPPHIIVAEKSVGEEVIGWLNEYIKSNPTHCYGLILDDRYLSASVIHRKIPHYGIYIVGWDFFLKRDYISPKEKEGIREIKISVDPDYKQSYIWEVTRIE